MNAFHVHQSWHRKLNTVVTAFVFICVGLLFLGRNMGIVDEHIFHIFVSWQMLLIVIGATQLIKRNFIAGLILIAVGSYFLFPMPYGLGTFWPVFLIIIGIGLLFKLGKKDDNCHTTRSMDNSFESSTTENGFITSNISFGSAKHIVLDPVFKGADLRSTFGSIVLDLRRTQLEGEKTFIDMNATFSGIELYMPTSWNVILEAETTLGGIDDKRYISHEVNNEHKLIIRGNITFSGIEIKN